MSPPGAHAVLTIDGAGWHQKGDKLRVPNNITLLHLPPYRPYVRSHFLPDGIRTDPRSGSSIHGGWSHSQEMTNAYIVCRTGCP
jgi:hypothetical protein